MKSLFIQAFPADAATSPIELPGPCFAMLIYGDANSGVFAFSVQPMNGALQYIPVNTRVPLHYLDTCQLTGGGNTGDSYIVVIATTPDEALRLG